MQRVPKPGGSNRALSNFCMLASPGASSLLADSQTQTGNPTATKLTCGGGVPEEGHLFLVHPGLQLQAGVLPERRDDEAEDQGDADEHGRKDNLETHGQLRRRADTQAGRSTPGHRGGAT